MAKAINGFVVQLDGLHAQSFRRNFAFFSAISSASGAMAG